MWTRNVADSLLKRFRWRFHFSYRGSSRISSCTKIYALQCYPERCKWNVGSILPILLHGQAALLVGGSCSFVFAEEVSGRLPSEDDTGVSNTIDLQQVQDDPVISNEHTKKWRVFTDSGRDYFLQGKLNDAENLFTAAIEEAKMGFGEQDPHVASACNNLAELYRVRKEYDKAEPLYLHAIRILEEAFGLEDVRVGAAFHNLGQFYIAQRKLEEAKTFYERALKIKGRILGLDNPDYAETVFHLGTVLYLQGNVKDAEILIQDSIKIFEDKGQAESYACIRKLRYLAKIYVKSDRGKDAENVQRKILHIMELTKGWNSLDTIIAADGLSATFKLNGKLKDAQDLLERCLNIRRTLLPQDHLQIGANMLSLANVALLNFEQLRKSETAEALMELDRAKELLTDSIRMAQKVLDATKRQRNFWAPKQLTGNDERAALVILLQSLIAAANVEMAKQKLQETEKVSCTLQAEKVLRKCIDAFKQYGAVDSTSASVQLKVEYVLCLKKLLKIIADTTNNIERSNDPEVEKLKDEIRQVEAEISFHKTPCT